MKAVIIGSGFIASVHAEAILSQGHSIHMIIGRTLDSVKEFAHKYNIPNVSDNIEDIQNSDIEIVHVCTPPASHYSMVDYCLNHNKHVICEKPLCLNEQEAFKLVKLATYKNLLVSVNFNVRYHSFMNSIKETIQNTDFGDVTLMHGNYLQEFHVLPSEYSWRFQEDTGGNMRAVTEIGSHIVDLLSFLTGLQIVEVSAYFNEIKVAIIYLYHK